EARPRAALRQMGRCGAVFRAAGPEALQLVELSRPRLAGERSRPPARPHLGDAAAREIAEAARYRARRAGLAGRLRPCAGLGHPGDLTGAADEHLPLPAPGALRRLFAG